MMKNYLIYGVVILGIIGVVLNIALILRFVNLWQEAKRISQKQVFSQYTVQV